MYEKGLYGRSVKNIRWGYGIRCGFDFPTSFLTKGGLISISMSDDIYSMRSSPNGQSDRK